MDCIIILLGIAHTPSQSSVIFGTEHEGVGVAVSTLLGDLVPRALYRRSAVPATDIIRDFSGR